MHKNSMHILSGLPFSEHETYKQLRYKDSAGNAGLKQKINYGLFQEEMAPSWQQGDSSAHHFVPSQ